MNSEELNCEETSMESTENIEYNLPSTDVLETVSGDLDIDYSVSNEIITYGAYESYDGSISTTYTTYFSGFACKREYGSNYVLFRSDNYNYVYVEGDLSADDGQVEGSGNVYTLSTYRNCVLSCVYDDNISIDTSVGMIYSDLSGYPSLPIGVSDLSFNSLYFALVTIGLSILLNGWFSYGKNRNVYFNSNI